MLKILGLTLSSIAMATLSAILPESIYKGKLVFGNGIKEQLFSQTNHSVQAQETPYSSKARVMCSVRGPNADVIRIRDANYFFLPGCFGAALLYMTSDQPPGTSFADFLDRAPSLVVEVMARRNQNGGLDAGSGYQILTMRYDYGTEYRYILFYKGYALFTDLNVGPEGLNKIFYSYNAHPPQGSVLRHGLYTANDKPIGNVAAKPCNDDRIVDNYNKNDSNYHFYSITNGICSKTLRGCTREKVFQTMISQEQFIVPSLLDDKPVVNCREKTLTGKNPIRTTINSNDYSITNYTLPGHIFHPGKITRRVTETNNAIAVTTIGEGVGDGKKFNMWVAPDIWTSADGRLSVRVRLILSYENN